MTEVVGGGEGGGVHIQKDPQPVSRRRKERLDHMEKIHIDAVYAQSA